MRFTSTIGAFCLATLALATPAQAEDFPSRAQLTVRGGYANYYRFHFVTVGAEAAVRVIDNVHVMAGFEGFGVNRVLPPDIQLETGDYSRWNTVLPANLGGMYKFRFADIFQPYVGADVVMAYYYKDEDGGFHFAFGGRLRGGLDVMFHPNIGANANLSLGGWTGQYWEELETGLKPAGLVPQGSLGIVFAL